VSREFVENNLLSDSDLERLNPKRYTLAERMKEWWVHGVSIAVIKGGKIEWARGYGVREVGKPEPVDTETMFQAGSISKPVAVLAALMLVEQGKLDLDADVNDYLKSWKVPPVNGWQPRLTMRQLLSHTGGTTVSGFRGYSHNEPVPSLAEILDGLPPANSDPIRADRMPGVGYSYSGGGTMIVQQMMLDVTGEDFESLLRRLVFEPLGMTHSTYQQPLPAAYHHRAATGHYYDGQPMDGYWYTLPELAAAGLWTTPTDVAHFGIAVWNAYQGKHPVISQQIANWMLTPHPATGNENPQLGLGMFLRIEGEVDYFGHGGANVGFRNTLNIFRESGDGIALMTNGDQGEDLNVEIRRAVAEAYGWSYFKPEPKAIVADTPQRWQTYVDKYELFAGCELNIQLSGSSLILEMSGQSPLKLTPLSETEFAIHTLNARLIFQREENGEVNALTLKQDGKEKTAKRVSNVR
jgi:CubicO group peptidase (beta-lactamase class C family)